MRVHFHPEYLVVPVVALLLVAAAIVFTREARLGAASPSAAGTGPAGENRLAGRPDVATTPDAGPEERAAALLVRGNDLLAQDKAQAALASYREAATLLPDDEDVHYNLGIALARLGQTNEAIAAYETALKLFPDYAEVHNNLGNLMLRAGNVDGAITHFRAALKALPDYAAGHNNLGNALRVAGQGQEAMTLFAKAVELNTNYWEARLNLANMYRSTGRFEEADCEYREVLRQKPDLEPVLRALASRAEAPPPPLR